MHCIVVWCYSHMIMDSSCNLITGGNVVSWFYLYWDYAQKKNCYKLVPFICNSEYTGALLFLIADSLQQAGKHVWVFWHTTIIGRAGGDTAWQTAHSKLTIRPQEQTLTFLYVSSWIPTGFVEGGGRSSQIQTLSGQYKCRMTYLALLETLTNANSRRSISTNQIILTSASINLHVSQQNMLFHLPEHGWGAFLLVNHQRLVQQDDREIESDPKT